MSDGANEKIHVFDRESMTEIYSFGDGGRQPGQFYAVHSIATDSKGNIYTTETYRGQRVQKFIYKGLAPVESTARGRAMAGRSKKIRLSRRRLPKPVPNQMTRIVIILAAALFCVMYAPPPDPRILSAINQATLDSGQQTQDDTDNKFYCPMDSDVRSAAPGVCPQCGMKLVEGVQDIAEYPVDLTVEPLGPRAANPRASLLESSSQEASGQSETLRLFTKSSSTYLS